MLLAVFLTTAAILWLTVFGYVGVLLVRVWRRWSEPPPHPLESSEPLPSIAVVVPVRNEERFVLAKLADLRRSEYPADRLRAIVVDGGSIDATARLVEAECERDSRLTLVRVEHARGKSEQLNVVLESLREDIVVVTDVDSELDPSCLRSLVESLRAHPGTDLVGARIRPATSLLEERIHWWLLNSLWWLEGEALGNGQVSGVCFALRASAVSALPPDCTAEDIRFGLLASARGRHVRLCRHALATELRVPHSAREFVTFRRRRGSGYLRELRRVRPVAAPLRWHFVQALRLYHFFVMPPLAAALTVAALVLLATPDWHWPVLAAAAFAIPAAAALFASTTLGEGRRWRLGLAAGRLAALTWLSLVAVPREQAASTRQRVATAFAKGGL
jgi:cellulose synthase/poly-beta-1,6-N-acetylglucosamine synthase-like glycosyltransferase